jgi:hypothetical protein
MSSNIFTLFLFLFFGLSVSCANPISKAVDKVKYSAWETVGVEKRDLFKSQLRDVKDDQEDTQESFKDALTKLKEVYAFDGGNLEREYNKLNSSYENALSDADSVKKSIDKLNTIANDLFDEWREEIKSISTASYREKSREQLNETKSKYMLLHKNLVASEKRIGPVLGKLKDQVLYLKHNLNAQAISGLKAEGVRIESDIQKLMKDMEASSREADEFIKTL